MLHDRNQKKFEFKPVNGDELKSMDVTEIREALLKGKYTSVDLVNFFGHRVQTLGRELGLTTEELFEDAMKMASMCDMERKDAISKGESDKLPFLHGIPVSIKDLFDMKGTLSTVGCAMLNQRAEEDSPAITPILNAGAIPICKGNVP
jgi:Asp-tRNA(Asn)/Glu-tRNA(Gln) amidotransferase A subunit family amidase